MALTTTAPGTAVEEPTPRRLTVEEFERIPDGVFPEGERLELIDGLIYTKVGRNDPHYFALLYALRALQRIYGSDFTVVSQMPTRFGVNGKVEPDILVLRGQIEDYEGRKVDPQADVVLLVEVSDTSLPYDAGLKAGLYATYGVPEYWIVNVRSRTLEVRCQPQPEPGFYAETLVLLEDKGLPLGDGSIRVTDLLPKTTQG